MEGNDGAKVLHTLAGTCFPAICIACKVRLQTGSDY